jgi:hypothetical protein
MIVFGVSGMSYLAYRGCEGFEHLWANTFWAFHRFYLPTIRAGIMGVVLVFVALFGIRQGHVNAAVIIAIIVACWVKLWFSWYALIAYARLREARKAYWNEKPLPPVERAPEDPYLQMLLGFATLPKWFNGLSYILTLLIIVCFTTIPLALLNFTEGDNPINGKTKLVKNLTESEPLYVHFHSTASPPLRLTRIWFSKFPSICSQNFFFTFFFIQFRC